MRINMFKFYKTSFICSLILGIFTIIGSVIFTIYYYSGVGIDDFIMLFIGVPLGLSIIIFPICINYRQLGYITIDKNECISYSFFKREICRIDFCKRVYYSFFDVKFSYSPSVKFIAFSNQPFICNQKSNSVFKKSFYGSYDKTQIIILPYDKNLPLLLKDFTNQSGDG